MDTSRVRSICRTSRTLDIVRGQTDVLNGIAYDAKHDRLFVTGKNWPKLFEIRVHAEPAQPPSP